MSDGLRVHFYTLTDTQASEHLYMAALREALLERGVHEVDDWRDADVVHLFEVNAFTGAALSSFRYPELLRILRSETPVVVSTDDLYFTGEPELTARPRLYPLNHHVQRRLFRACDAVIAISESVRGRLEPHLQDTPIHTVLHGVDPAYRADAADAGIARDEPFVLHVSLASQRKNPEAVVETARRVDDRFVIAGSAWPEIVPDGPAFDDVETPGYVPEAELIDLYRDAAVFYFPTLHEGFGLPVLEAMAAGCGVVTTDVYSVPEVADDAAVLLDPRDVDAHVAAVGDLLDDDRRRRALATAAVERSEGFSWAKSARETEAVYQSAIGDR